MKKSDLSAGLCIGLFYLGIELLEITCPIKYVTGISCAGCGMSRAVLSLLRGDLRSAFYYHPLFWILPLVGVLLLFSRKIPKTIMRVILTGVGALFLLVYAGRMMTPADEIVVFRPKEGLLYQIAAGIASMGKALFRIG